MLQRYLWKLLPKPQRAFLLGRLSVVDRQVINKSMSASLSFPRAFEQRSCLFIHVPKCAGSSVCAAMFDGWSPGHLPLYWYEQQFPEQFAASFKFAFVRDPLERAYSAYAFLRGNELGRRDQAAQRLVCHYRDFDDFVARWLHSETISRQIHFAAQTDFSDRFPGASGPGLHRLPGTSGAGFSPGLRTGGPLGGVASRQRLATAASDACPRFLLGAYPSAGATGVPARLRNARL